MARILTALRLFGIACIAVFALALPSLSAHAAPSSPAPVSAVKCDSALLKKSHDTAKTAVAYLNILDDHYNNASLTKALNEEKKVVDNTKDCKHLSTAYTNAYAAAGDFYNFYYGLPVGEIMVYPNAAAKWVGTTQDLVGQVYNTAK